MGKVLHTKGISGGGGTGTGWDGQVEFRADLPITLGTPIVGEIYLVEKKTTLLGFTTYQSGLYIRDLNNGSLSDWRRLNVKVNFTDSEFAVVSAADNSKKAKFDMSLITTSTTRNYTWQDKDLTVAGLDDLNGYLPLSGGTMTGDITMTSGAFILSDGGEGKIKIDDALYQLELGQYAANEDSAIIYHDKNSYLNVLISVDAGFNITKAGQILMVDTSTFDSTLFDVPMYLTGMSSQNATLEQGTYNSGAFGGENIIVKTPNTIYGNQVGFSNNPDIPITAVADNGGGTVIVSAVNTLTDGDTVKMSAFPYEGHFVVSSVTATSFVITHAFTTTATGKAQGYVETILGNITPTQDNSILLQNGSGTLAFLSDISPSLRNITATDTFVTASETLNCTANTFTVNLPTAVGIQGVTYTLVNSGTGIITLDANGTETINGSLTIEIKRQYLSRTVQSDGTNWIVI